MPDLAMTAAIDLGGYISLFKLIPFVVLFYLWLTLVTWLYNDADSIDINSQFWGSVIFAAGAVVSFLWLFIPYLVGLGIFLLAVASAAISYIIHRNSQVQDSDKLMTADHFKNLFVNEEKKLEKLKSFVFVTANKNEVPMPQPKTEDFFGYKITHDLFVDAIWRRAENIMFSPSSGGYLVVYYIDGVPAKQPAMDREQIDSFIRFIKKLANLDEREKRKPQHGKFQIKQNNEKTQWQVTTAGSTAGEQVKIKRVQTDDILRLDEIGLTSDQYNQLSQLSELKTGLFLVTGPAKSGVTTTFYSLIRNHDAFLNSINTLERNPAVELPNVVQEVYSLSDTGTSSYANKLHRIVRMGPDIVGVADCADNETAKIAAEGVKTGKLIYVELKADSVMQALSKWIKLVGDRNLAVDNLVGISNQRILRKLCPECRQPYEPNPQLLKKFNLPADKARILYRAGKVQYDKHGKAFTCEQCQGTGFIGREGIFESIRINDDLRKTIKTSKTLSEISSRFRMLKMLYLQEQALRRVISGTTAVNEMVRVLTSDQAGAKKKSSNG